MLKDNEQKEWIEFHNGSTEADNLPDVAFERHGTNISNVCSNRITRLDESTAMPFTPTCALQCDKRKQ